MEILDIEEVQTAPKTELAPIERAAIALESSKTEQHLRAMREKEIMTNDQFLSDLLYCGHMGELSESTIKEACERFNIEFPPQQHKGHTNEHSLHDLGPVRHRKNHQPAQPQPC